MGGKKKALRNTVLFNLSLSCLIIISMGRNYCLHNGRSSHTMPLNLISGIPVSAPGKGNGRCGFHGQKTLKISLNGLRGTRRGEEGYISFRDDRRGSHQVIKSFNLLFKQMSAQTPEFWLYYLSLTFSVKYAQFRKKMFSFVFKSQPHKNSSGAESQTVFFFLHASP